MLCVSPMQLKETLKNDAGKAAKEVALSLQPSSQEQELAQQDAKYKRIAPLAIQCIRHHFMHAARETGKAKRAYAREFKKEASPQPHTSFQPGRTYMANQRSRPTMPTMQSQDHHAQQMTTLIN